MLNEKALKEILETHGVSPWKILIEEGKTEEVNSDDDPTPDTGLSDEDKQAIVQGLQSGEISEKAFQSMVKDGKIDEEDAQEIMQMLQQGQQEQEMTSEEQQMMQINQIQDMTVRFSLYEKYTELNQKIEYFLDFFQDINTPFYKEIENIKSYIDVISNLIFALEINLLYQLFFQIESKLIDLFQEYLESKNQEGNING